MTDVPEVWQVHCDGSAVPNPGRMGLGAVLQSAGGARHTVSLPSPDRGCNNEAEVRALMAAMGAARSLGAQALRLHCDNSVVVEQVNGTAAQPVDRLAPLFDQARAMLAAFDDATLVWVPRHRNREADALARAAVGLPPKLPALQRKRRR